MKSSADTPVGQVNDLIFGRWKSRILYAGVTLGIFDLLSGKRQASSEITRLLKLDARNGYRLLRALAGIGLLKEEPGSKPTEEGGEFSLTAAGECLCAQHPSNLAAVVLLQESPEHTAIWRHLPAMVREGWQNGFRREYGSGAFEYADTHAEYSRTFDTAMASYSAQQASAAVEALRDFDFIGVETVCDIGGGRGVLLEALLQSRPQLRGIILERSAVIQQAASDGSGQRGWSYQVGDMFKSVPAADLYLLKLILHDWDDEQCVRLLRNIRAAALACGRPEARLLIFEFVIPPPGTPHFSKLYDIHMMCWGDGRERTLPQYQQLLARAGWKLRQLRALPAVDMGMIEAG